MVSGLFFLPHNDNQTLQKRLKKQDYLDCYRKNGGKNCGFKLGAVRSFLGLI